MNASLRLLMSSNAFWCSSGYGVQSGSLLPRLAELPEFGGEPGSAVGRRNIAQFAWYGLEGGVHHVDGFKVYPKAQDPYGNDVIGAHTRDFGANIVVSLIDVWVMHETAQKIAPALWLPWLPIDHDPIPQRVLDSLRGAYLPLTYAKWGHQMLTAAGVENHYIPHGIETGTFRIVDDPENATRFKRDLTNTDDAHLTVMVAANKGYPDRKAFQFQLAAWAEFAKDKPDARLYIHTEPTTVYGGIDFPALIVQLGVGGRIIVPDRYKYLLGFPADHLASVYNVADAYLGASMSEGFGIPLIEAQACGCPVITTDFSAMPELVRWGYATKPMTRWWTPMNSFQVLPDPERITAALNELYAEWIENDRGRGAAWQAKRAEASAAIHEEYNWDTIVHEQWRPLIARLVGDAPPLDARFAPSASPVSERSVEVPWLLERLNGAERILDVGSADAEYRQGMADACPTAEITLMDKRSAWIPPERCKGFRMMQGDAAEMPADWTAQYDLVTCISTLDHVGLAAYGNPADETALDRTVTELRRVTAPGGRLLLTVPYGRDQVTTHPAGGQRVFGLDALRDLFPVDAWEWRGMDCWRLNGSGYEPCNVTIAEQAEYAGWRAGAVIALELVRKAVAA